ncbi:MAG: zinc metallopeptidase [Oscillospiraceae bacterium]
MYFDSTYLIVLPALIFAMIAQIKVKSAFEENSRVFSRRGVTAYQAVREILDSNGLYNVMIEHVSGDLTDHYDPKSNVIRLSDSVYNSTSVAAIGVAAHEAGHAIQYAEGYFPIKIRSAIIPVTQLGSRLAMPLVLIGLLFHNSLGWLVTAGIILYTAVVLFQAVTLPVEFNASHRALQILDSKYMLDTDELKKAKSVLSAAAMTYVAAMLSALLSLLRLLVLANGRGNRRR